MNGNVMCLGGVHRSRHQIGEPGVAQRQPTFQPIRFTEIAGTICVLACHRAELCEVYDITALATREMTQHNPRPGRGGSGAPVAARQQDKAPRHRRLGLTVAIDKELRFR
jgi:hypothetical protein